MEQIGSILNQDQDRRNISTTTLTDRIAQAKERLKAEEAKFLCPRWDGEKYVETSCLTCRDLGWVVSAKDGRDESYPCPDCGGRFDRTASMLKYSGIPEARQSQRFESWKSRTGAEESFCAVKVLTDIEKSFDLERVFMLLIYGGTGNGKTHLAHASGMDAIEKGIPTRFIRCDALLREFKAAKSQSDEGQAKYDELFTGYSEALYLIIDEFDWDTEADIRMLEKLVCAREANQLMTLITTNRDVLDLEDTMPKMMSRFHDKRFARIVHNKGADFRKLKGGQK